MSIIIFGDSFTFPDGNAATNRVYTYAKGFLENGLQAHVICFKSEYGKCKDGLISDIHFYHPFKPTKRSDLFVIRRWFKLKKYFNTIKLIKKINKTDKVIAIVCYSQLLLTEALIFYISKLIKCKILLERGEHPLRNYQTNSFRKIQGEIKTYLEVKLCTGINCISQYLVNLYKARGVNPSKLFLIPSTVDTTRFNILSKPLFPFEFILYCGALSTLKDGVNILIESFASISEKFPAINLVLIGKGETKEEEIFIRDLVLKLKLDKRVFFLGQLSRMKIPEYLITAKILALARPKSIQADAGFPSKLTEYLAAEVPVIVTKVGEIPSFLTHKETAFVCEPDSIADFATNIDFVLSNYEFAKQVAKNGKKLTNTVFNYNVQAKRMIDFIKSV